MNWITVFFSEFYYLVSEMAPYLLLGFLFAGLLKAFFPQKGISKFLGRKNFRSVANAALFGVPMPLCSCGVIPTGVSLYKSGATKGATTSFLISTPQTGVDSIMATYSLLGLPFAILRPVVAFVSGIIGGVLSHVFEKDQSDLDNSAQNSTSSGNGSEESIPQNGWSKIGLVFRYGFGELVEDIVKWMVIGLLAAAFISVMIPDSFFSQYIGSGFIEMIIVLAASIPMYICATGSIPMAAVLLMKGLSPGAALVLLMAGPATNIATITVIGKVMGRKSLLIYLFSIIGGALGFGLLVNAILPSSWFSLASIASHQHSILPVWLKLSSTILLAVMILLASYRKWFRHWFLHGFGKNGVLKSDTNLNMNTIIKVDGMTCSHCKANVESKLANLQGVNEAIVNLQDGTVSIEGDIDFEDVDHTVTGLGYKYKGIINQQ